MRGVALALAFAASAHAAPPAEWMGTPDAAGEYVDEPVFGGRVALYRAGPRDAEPVVLVHGLGQSGARDWANVVPALAGRYAVYAVDLPGFGQSSKGNHLYSPRNLSRALMVVLRDRVKPPFALVGHSMGGAVALAYVADYPEHVGRLVLVGTAGVLHRSVYGEFLARAAARRALGADSPWLEPIVHAIQMRAESFPVPTELALGSPAIRARLLRGEPNAIAALALAEHDFSEALPAIRAPTVIVWGARDPIAPPRTGETLAAAIPGARLVTLEGLGHTPQIEAPERFNPVLLEALDGRSLAAPPYALAEAPWTAGREGRCDHTRGETFTGDYEKLVLEGCGNAVIRNARVGRLRAEGSTFRMVNSHVRDGLEARHSRVELTGVRLGGTMVLDATNVDAAAVRVDTPSAIASNSGDTAPVVLRFSVSRVSRSGYGARPLHDVFHLAPGETLIR